MQTHSPLHPHPLTQPLATLFGPRAPEAALRHAQADLAACRVALRNGSKTFLAASFLLPRGTHEPAAALYAFCRLADDAVDDGDGKVDETGDRRGAVERLRERLRLAYAGTPQDDPADRALAIVVARHAIPAALFDALLEGFEWDLQGRHYDTLDQLTEYAARVAGTVGAMMAVLMGARTPAALARATDLGAAMQLSNIARDVGEDARMGRLYLPRDWLLEAGIDPDAWLAKPTFTPALASVVQRLLDAAEVLYARVGAGVARLPLACRPGINAARFIYAEIGREVARRGFDSVSARAHVSATRKVALLMRSVALVAPAARGCSEPPLPANRFLIDAVLAASPRVEPCERRSLVERVVWAFELFARLEQRQRERSGRSPHEAGIAT
jgi:15-cis-phytoene synthase